MNGKDIQKWIDLKARIGKIKSLRLNIFGDCFQLSQKSEIKEKDDWYIIRTFNSVDEVSNFVDGYDWGFQRGKFGE